MKLPENIMAGLLNLSVSRHQNPEALDWQNMAGKWIATEEGRGFVILHDTQFGFVVAETKAITYELGGEVK